MRNASFRKRIAGIVVLAAVFAVPRAFSQDSWEIFRVTETHKFTDMGPRSLAFDSAGHPRIAYGGSGLYYAWHDGETWHTGTADGAPGVGRHASLALTNTEDPRIAYYDAENGDLKYAREIVSSGVRVWLLETVDSDGDVGESCSLALDDDGRPNISYYDRTNGALKYARRGILGWTLVVVDAADNAGVESSIALDAAGNPAVAYVKGAGAPDRLYYAWFDGTAWHTEAVPSSGMGARDPNLIFDSHGHPLIGFVSSGFTHLVLMAWRSDTGLWTITTVDPGTPGGTELSMFLQRYDRPYFSYYALGSRDLRYADPYLGPDEELHWNLYAVETRGDIGRYSSIAGDLFGTVGISFYDVSGAALRYRDLMSPVSDFVDWSHDWGTNASLALDPSELPHVAFYDADHKEILYAYFDGAGWGVEPVELDDDSIDPPLSLAIGSDGLPRLAYYDGIRGLVRFARKIRAVQGYEWVTETVEADVIMPVPVLEFLRIRLALDGNDVPHLAYTAWDEEADAPDVRYARKVGDSWPVEVVETTAGGFLDFVLDPEGGRHLAYRMKVDTGWDYALRYAHRPPFGLADWTRETLDEIPGIAAIDLTLDPDGDPHISYAGGVVRSLRYAGWNGEEWVRRDFPLQDPVDTAIGAYGKDDVRIVYADFPSAEDGHSLRTVRFDPGGGNPVPESTVDEAGDAGAFCSMQLDSAGVAHVAYYDATNGGLRYAREGDWVRPILRWTGIERVAPGVRRFRWTGSCAGIDILRAARPDAHLWEVIAANLFGTRIEIKEEDGSARRFYKLRMAE